MAKTNFKTLARAKRIRRIRKNISGTPDRPRLRVFKSNKHIYAQIIDDVSGHSLIAMSTTDKQFDLGDESGKTAAAAKKVGVVLAERATAAGIKKVIFDRGGYLYHGRVKALSDGAREGGLEF